MLYCTDLFGWDIATMFCLRKNDIVMEKKQKRILVCLFELLLQLSLDPSHNIVSSNLGLDPREEIFLK